MSDDVGDQFAIEPANASLSPSAGVLSSGGAATVYARIYHHPAPQIVPAGLSAVLDPIAGADGRLRDWSLNPAKVIAHHPNQTSLVRKTYDQWRTSFVKETSLGDLATIRAFLSWAPEHVDVSSLRVLLGAEARIDPATTIRVARQVEDAGKACRASTDPALGIASPTRPGLVRGFLLHDQPSIVLAAGGAQLTASTDGLRLTRTHTPAPFPAAVLAETTGHAWTTPVTGWTVTARGVTVTTDTGDTELGDSTAAKLLTYVAPGVAHVRTYEVPLTSVFAALLTELPAIAKAAARSAKPLTISH